MPNNLKLKAMKTEVNEYQKQANDFLEKMGAEIKIKFMKHAKHFENDKEERDIYAVILRRGKRSFNIQFGQSLNKSGFKLLTGAKREIKIPTNDKERDQLIKSHTALTREIERTVKFTIQNCDKIIRPEAPTAYDILACLTKYDPGTFEDFCGEFGYDEDSKSAERVYKAVKEEYLNVCSLFNDAEIEELAEIQ